MSVMNGFVVVCNSRSGGHFEVLLVLEVKGNGKEID